MDFDLTGYLEAEPLPTSKALIPVFEAIINSIHASEEIPGSQISVEIEREPQLHLAPADKDNRPHEDIVGFRIIDGGVGFTEPNFKSFETSYSRYKKKKGAKGIGRFSWLKAFESASIESFF